MASRVQVVSEDFLRGLLDTQDETGLEVGWARFENLRVGTGRGKPRPGMIHLVTPTQGAQGAWYFQASGYFDGVDEYYEIPVRDIHTLPAKFDMELCFEAETLVGTAYLWGVKHADYGLKIRRTTTDVEVLIHDGANSVTHNAGPIATAYAYALRIRYDGTTLTTWLEKEHDHTTAASTEAGTVSGTLRAPGGNMLVGADGAVPGDFWDGWIEYIRCFSKHLPSQRHMWQYWPHPKGRYVLWDYYPGILDAGDLLMDHSRNLNTGSPNGTPGPDVSLLDPCQPTQAIAHRIDGSNRRRVVAVCGGVPYEDVS